MADFELTQNESDWVFDYVMHLFQSPTWEVPIISFIEENCACFDMGEENKFIYTDLHQQFRELVENVLCTNLAELGLTPSDFAEICERSRSSSDISIEVVTQILAMDDFLTFKKLMIKRNLELELEAIKALKEETEDATGNAIYNMEAHFMELSVLYKQEEMEQAELESALALSLSVQEERLRLATVASKAAEDKYDETPEKRQNVAPEVVRYQVHASKKKAEEIFRKNKDSLEENRSKQKELREQAEVSDDELKRREEYLRRQRDRILEKKRKEREEKLRDYRQEQKETAPEPPAVIQEKMKVLAQEECKTSEAEKKRNALRLALARRMKQDLLESSSEENSTTFDINQLAQLDEKMRRVEELRRQSQERERRAQDLLASG